MPVLPAEPLSTLTLTPTPTSTVRPPPLSSHSLTHLSHLPSRSSTYPTILQHAPFPPTREKVPHNKHLQPRDPHHKHILNNAKPENPLFRAAHSTEVAVLARAKVLLVPCDGGQLPGQLVDGFLEVGGLFRWGALFGREGGAGFVLDLGSGVSAVVSLVR